VVCSEDQDVLVANLGAPLEPQTETLGDSL